MVVVEAEFVEDFWAIESSRSHCFVVGLDLGKQRDFTALVVNEAFACENVHYKRSKFEPDPHPVARKRIFRHSIVNIRRYPLGTPYPEIYASVKKVMEQLPPREGLANQLVADQTGVGGPVLDGLRHIGLRPIGVTITGGTAISHISHDTVNVPKGVLASTLDAALGQNRLDITSAAAGSQQFRDELAAFQVKIRASGVEAFEAEREQDHDDLVMAAALAVWRGDNLPVRSRMAYIPRNRI